jgi:hypothetical protein
MIASLKPTRKFANIEAQINGSSSTNNLKQFRSKRFPERQSQPHPIFYSQHPQ